MTITKKLFSFASSKNLIKNLLNSLDSNSVNSVVLDFEGKYKQIKNCKKYVFGKDFRIPLNNLALEYIFNYGLEDLPFESKATVQSIIIEVEKYIETLPDRYISFDIFSDIIFEEFKNSRDSGLLIFANKLTQYKQRKIFANEAEEFKIINSLKGSSVIDISDVETKFHKLIFDSAVSLISGKYYLFADISEDNADKGIIKHVYEKNNIRLIPVCRHDEKYLSFIKQYSNNFAVFAPAVKSRSEEQYEYFLDKLTQNDFILYGEGTMSIPLLVSMNKLNADLSESSTSFDKIDIVTNQDLDDLDFLNRQEVTVADLQTENQVVDKIYSFSEVKHEIPETTEVPVKTEIPLIPETPSVQEVPEINNKNKVVSDNVKPEIRKRVNTDGASDYINIIYPDDVKEDENSLISRKSINIGNVSEIQEAAQKNSTVENFREIPQNVQPVQFVKPVENLQPAVQSVSTVQSAENVQPVVQNAETVQFVYNEPEKQPEQTFVQEERPVFSFEKSNKPKADELPVYEPKEPPKNNVPDFEIGNRVKHAKYGLGNVENIMNYGDKKLCCIVFDNVGRKLLDPNITTIEKLF